jgi:thioredoxin 1
LARYRGTIAATARIPEGARTAMLLQDFQWKKEVLQSPEPVLVDFWAPWCAPCRTMEPTIAALARDFKVAKVNVDKNQELAAHYDVSSIPALLIFKDGKIAARHLGVTPEATLRAELERLQRS